MNNSIEIIEIDHGWSQMKTSNYCFNTSIKELPNVPAFTDNVLQYDNRYFAVGYSNRKSLCWTVLLRNSLL